MAHKHLKSNICETKLILFIELFPHLAFSSAAGTTMNPSYLRWKPGCYLVFLIFQKMFTDVQLIYNVVLISAAQQTDSVIHTHILFQILSIRVHHRILNIVSCVTVLVNRTVLLIYLKYSSLHLLTPNSQPIPPLPSLPLGNTSLFSMSESLDVTMTSDLPHFGKNHTHIRATKVCQFVPWVITTY